MQIARALYQDCDIYLIDDCLSALDAHVGKKIFDKVIINHLKKNGKTVIFATHAIHFLKFFDKSILIKIKISRRSQESSSRRIRNLRAAFPEPKLLILPNAGRLEKGGAR